MTPLDRVKDLLEKGKPALASVLPKEVGVERFIKVIVSNLARNPGLLECSPQSIIRAAMQAAEMGLELGGMTGEAYLVPYTRSLKVGNQWQKQKEAQCIPGYRGLIKLAYKGGKVDRLEARIVYEGDSFEVEYGTTPFIRHKPAFKDRGQVSHVYAVAKLTNGQEIVEVMSTDDIERIRIRSKKGDRESPWDTDTEEMYRKTVLRRIFKYLPIEASVADVVYALDENHQIPAAPPTGLLETIRRAKESMTTEEATRVDELAKEIGDYEQEESES